jgi:hypothetical protein
MSDQDTATAPPVTHEIELIHPIYGQHGASTAFCTCGWASEELPTAGRATIAGWQHINDPSASPTRPDLGTETVPVDQGNGMTAGQATIAGYSHIREAKPKGASECLGNP